MHTVYVVMGTTGEYSDRDEWAVCAYTSEDSAKTHVERATARARELFERIQASVYFDYNEMAALQVGEKYHQLGVEVYRPYVHVLQAKALLKVAEKL